jgi:hypothetical protein
MRSNWREATEHEASPEQVAFREAEYDRICPRWRAFKYATHFTITRGIGLDLQRRPFDGSWMWGAGGGYESRFSFDSAVVMMKRIQARGITDAHIAPNVVGNKPPDVTAMQVTEGDIQP